MQSEIERSFYYGRVGTISIAVMLVFIAAIGAIGLLAQATFWLGALGVGWAAAFVALAVYCVRLGSKTHPVVSVSPAGLHDRRLTSTPLPWSAIQSVAAQSTAQGMTSVGLYLNDSAALDGAKFAVRASAWMSALTGAAPVTISMTLLDGSDDDLLAAIAQQRPELVAATSAA